MLLLKTLRSNHLHSSLNHQKPAAVLAPRISPQTSNSRVSHFPPISSQRRISSLAAQEIPTDAKSRSLSSIFSKPPSIVSKVRAPSSPKYFPRKEKKGFTDAPAEDSKPENRSKPISLSTVFSKPSVVPKVRNPSSPNDFPRKEKKGVVLYNSSRYPPLEEKDFPEELSSEAAELVSRLLEDGYLKGANFSQSGRLEPHQMPANLYSRHFLKSAAEKFGQDHQEIAKWLSGSDLKKVALFGCPSVETKTVFAAKRLRSFFRIQEDITCQACKLKVSCKFMNQRVGSEDKVILADVMRLITLFTLDSVPRQLSVPNDLEFSINKLLKEVIKLSN